MRVNRGTAMTPSASMQADDPRQFKSSSRPAAGARPKPAAGSTVSCCLLCWRWSFWWDDKKPQPRPTIQTRKTSFHLERYGKETIKRNHHHNLQQQLQNLQRLVINQSNLYQKRTSHLLAWKRRKRQPTRKMRQLLRRKSGRKRTIPRNKSKQRNRLPQQRNLQLSLLLHSFQK